MAEAMLSCLTLLAAACGMAWLALAMQPHWQQVRGAQPLALRTRRLLRVLGCASLALALLFCVLANHASMAALVWLMVLSASALSVALILAWQPRRLAWLIAWVRHESERE